MGKEDQMPLMPLSIEEAKRSSERVRELTEALEKAPSDNERTRIIEELKELVKKGLGVKGTA